MVKLRRTEFLLNSLSLGVTVKSVVVVVVATQLEKLDTEYD